MTFEGYFDTEVFNAWFKEFLVPILQHVQTVILDNATLHKSKKIVEFSKSVGAEILYLPPYSPDFNDIEHHWFTIKNRAERTLLLLNLFVKLLILLSYKPFRLLYYMLYKGSQGSIKKRRYKY